MDEILYELREHAAGLNAGRWDYLFSVIKKLPRRPDARILPDRAQLTMTIAVHARLHASCSSGRATAAAPTRSAGWRRSSRPGATRRSTSGAMAKVRDDKERESGDGFDGTWVAHPDLVPLATEIFDAVLGDEPNQKDRGRARSGRPRPTCSTSRSPAAAVTEAGVRANVRSRSRTSTPGCAATARPPSTT